MIATGNKFVKEQVVSLQLYFNLVINFLIASFCGGFV